MVDPDLVLVTVEPDDLDSDAADRDCIVEDPSAPSLCDESVILKRFSISKKKKMTKK